MMCGLSVYPSPKSQLFYFPSSPMITSDLLHPSIMLSDDELDEQVLEFQPHVWKDAFSHVLFLVLLGLEASQC